ncbi:NAD(P)H-dependent oxidoreductase [Nocardia asteroides]|uniref:NAD(P)H-dependent oxidoreductase n=1 Tax=Nocardia asteroides TaxID=1824 RepID=UPI0034346525
MTLSIGIILGSTRPQRNGPQVARWVLDTAAGRGDAEFTLVDLLDHPLPHLDEAVAPMFGPSAHPHTRNWAATIAGFDGFVVVTPEYNHGAPGVLKNAIDHLFAEWADKAVGFVSYGAGGGIRAVEQLRAVCGALGMADVRAQVAISVLTDFVDYTRFTPAEHHTTALHTLLDQVVAWSGALAPLRAEARKTNGQDAIRQTIDALVAGIHAKDLDALRPLYATEVVSFDVEPPLQHVGVAAKMANWATVFTVFDEVRYEVRDLTITEGRDIAFGHCFGRLGGVLRTGQETEGMWVRVTFCFQEIDGAWQIVHDQASVPFDVRSGTPTADLHP